MEGQGICGLSLSSETNGVSESMPEFLRKQRTKSNSQDTKSEPNEACMNRSYFRKSEDKHFKRFRFQVNFETESMTEVWHFGKYYLQKIRSHSIIIWLFTFSF